MPSGTSVSGSVEAARAVIAFQQGDRGAGGDKLDRVAKILEEAKAIQVRHLEELRKIARQGEDVEVVDLP